MKHDLKTRVINSEGNVQKSCVKGEDYDTTEQGREIYLDQADCPFGRFCKDLCVLTTPEVSTISASEVR